MKKIERESKRWEWWNSRGPLMDISLPPCLCFVREEKGNDITLKTVQYVFYTFCSGHCTCSCYKYYIFVSITRWYIQIDTHPATFFEIHQRSPFKTLVKGNNKISNVTIELRYWRFSMMWEIKSIPYNKCIHLVNLCTYQFYK